MHEALLYEKLPASRVRCNICQWRCNIGPGKVGVCQMYRNTDGVLYSMNYAEVSSTGIDPIEKKPLFHFHPGTLVFSLGTWGCNFHCKHCQNWQISCITPAFLERGSRRLSPQGAIEGAEYDRCQGIAWTYNEPTVWFEYTLDSAKLAKENGLYTVYVTNGYMTPEALDTIGPYLDAFSLDVKGFSDRFYQELARVAKWRGILEVAERAKEKWGIHVEVVTNIIPTMNDDDEQLEGIATWIRDKLGDLTPWHVTRFNPLHQMRHLPSTPISTLEHAYDIGKKVGLRFVYMGNVPGASHEDTVCYNCGNLVIARVGFDTEIVGLDGSKCRSCGADLNIRVGRKSR
jgi:pyruvate formate lyase activating enzyme